MFAALQNLARLFLYLAVFALPASTFNTEITRTNNTGPIVDLGYARYQGTVNSTTNITSFLGVRYAAPPTGSLRWRAPQSPEFVPGLQQANAFQATCFEAGSGISPTDPPLKKRAAAPSASEDCLFLDVYVPGSASERTVPVIVWIHGGGYISDTANNYDGSFLIEQSNNGVIVVSIEYRLGVFGFLAGTEVKKNGVLNAGLLDQNFALQWVQTHIHAFGGDPSKVTIWGESAGAGSVLQHIVAHGGRTEPQLFAAGITSSTFLPSQYEFDDEVPETLYSEVVSQANCSSSNDTLSCLRDVDVNTLQDINFNINQAGFFGTFVFVPVVDGSFIVERPTVTLAKGNANGRAVLSITNAFEGTIFVNATQPEAGNTTLYISDLFPFLDINQVEQGVALYAKTGGSTLDQVIGIMGESIFVCPTYFLLRAFNGRGHKGEFAIPPGTHGEDVAYYFPSLTLGRLPAAPFNNVSFIDSFSGSFDSFSVASDPNIKVDSENLTPAWGTWTDASPTEMLFNATANGDPDIHTFTTDRALLERCAFWASVANQTAQ
ncbi:hypothetical protein PLICRDRAFT_177155 [Plicaturopsis crispa FD-325 SS-3]|nr:hypothetical protein PLICRDRAFT_177155 [Plicaturopsis crispa FD-325 SS-3]